MRVTFVLPLVVLAVSGCAKFPGSMWEAKHGPDKPQFSYLPAEYVRSFGNASGIPPSSADAPSTGLARDPGDMYIWNPNANAAYVHPGNSVKTCIQAADVYRVNAGSAAAGLAAAAIGKQIADLNASAASSFAQSAITLSQQDVRGTFLSIALFNLCMANANGSITNEQMLQMFTTIVQESAKMTLPTIKHEYGVVSATTPDTAAVKLAAEKEKAEKEKAEKEKIEKAKAEKDNADKNNAEKEKATKAEKDKAEADKKNATGKPGAKSPNKT